MSAENLEQEIAGLTGRTYSAKLRQLMPTIDRRLREGVTRQEIVAFLQERGIDIKPRTFDTIVQRYRAKSRMQGGVVAPVNPESVQSTDGNPGTPMTRAKPKVEEVADDEPPRPLDLGRAKAMGNKFTRPKLGLTTKES